MLIHPPTPRARTILTAVAVIAGLGALLELVFTIIGLFSGQVGFFGVMESLGALLSVAVKAALAWFAWMARGRAVPREVTPEKKPDAPEPPGTPPTWRADQAAGSVWTRAGDAATGAAASTTAAPGTQGRGGWSPQPGQPSGPAGGGAGGGWQAQALPAAPSQPAQASAQHNPTPQPQPGSQPGQWNPAGPSVSAQVQQPTPGAWTTAGQAAAGAQVAPEEQGEEFGTVLRPPPQWKPADPGQRPPGQ